MDKSSSDSRATVNTYLVINFSHSLCFLWMFSLCQAWNVCLFHFFFGGWTFGKFPGILPLIWNPIFEVLKLRLGGCAVGYIELIESTMYDTDKALIMKNSSYVLVSFKVYANLYQVLLPFIRDRRMYQVIVESLEAGKPLLESLTNGEIDLCAINEVVRKGSNDLHDCL